MELEKMDREGGVRDGRPLGSANADPLSILETSGSTAKFFSVEICWTVFFFCLVYPNVFLLNTQRCLINCTFCIETYFNTYQLLLENILRFT